MLCIPGDYYDAHEKMLSFNPQYIHTTEPFKGTRYAITYYALTRWQELEPTAHKVLKDFGIQLPLTLSKVFLRQEPKRRDEPQKVRFGIDSSSDSSSESNKDRNPKSVPDTDDFNTSEKDVVHSDSDDSK